MTSQWARAVPVPADCAQARSHVATASRFLKDSMVEGISNEMRYGALYDSARNAITGVLAAAGIRITDDRGGHAETIREVRNHLGAEHATSLQRLNAALKKRNQMQYHNANIAVAEADALEQDAIALAKAALEFVNERCPG